MIMYVFQFLFTFFELWFYLCLSCKYMNQNNDKIFINHHILAARSLFIILV